VLCAQKAENTDHLALVCEQRDHGLYAAQRLV
jgi:hypothetical protein